MAYIYVCVSEGYNKDINYRTFEILNNIETYENEAVAEGENEAF